MLKTLESPLDSKEIQQVNPKRHQSWIFIWRMYAKSEAPILWPPDAKVFHWKRPWCWEILKAGEEGDDRGWDSWMASPTWWTWVWINSGSWWWTGRLGVLQFMGSQRVGHDWASELNWSEVILYMCVCVCVYPFSCSVMSDSLWLHEPQHTRPTVHHQRLESNQTNVHWVSDAIQTSHPLSSPSPPALNLSQYQGFFKWVSSSHQVAKVLEFQLQHQSFQWIFRTDL